MGTGKDIAGAGVSGVKRLPAELLEEQHFLGERLGAEERARLAVGWNVGARLPATGRTLFIARVLEGPGGPPTKAPSLARGSVASKSCANSSPMKGPVNADGSPSGGGPKKSSDCCLSEGRDE